MANRRSRGNARAPSFHSLFNPFQILRDVFFREAQCSTCAIAGQPLTSNLTHHCRAGDAATKLPDILNGVLRSLALERRARLHLLLFLYSSHRFIKLNVDTFERLMSHSLVTRFLSEDWARARWNFQHWLRGTYCARSFWTSHSYKSELPSISKGLLREPSLGEPLAKGCRHMTTPFTVQNNI
jgi:hypothetical protein